ncbi:MAG: hypothetical protein EOO04_10000 [Chitinophagaceae bacterium]|nr:MAG: hypothetical protein EOO04_10000 [Chitinophagaceae bacterium]
MRVLNENFSFTVKVNGEHFGGHFSYHRKGADVVKISCRRVQRKESKGYPYEQVNYLRLVKGKWILWDMNRRAPKGNQDNDNAIYAVFKEAYSLAQLAEA